MKSYRKEVLNEIQKDKHGEAGKTKKKKMRKWREALVSFWSGICIYLPQFCMYLGIGQTARNNPANKTLRFNPIFVPAYLSLR